MQEMDARNLPNINILEQRLAEERENGQRLSLELETLRNEWDKKLIEHQDTVDRERENYKKWMADLESKVKEAEHAKSQQFFEHEKEKAKLTFEKERMKEQIEDMSQQLEKSWKTEIA